MENLNKEFLTICYEARIGESDKQKLWALIKKASESNQVQAVVKPANGGLCKDCKHFEYSEDYNNVGDCNHPKFSDGIMFNHCDDMYVSEDFGCINYESKLSV